MIIDSGSRFNLLSQKDWGMLLNSGAVLLNIRTHSVNQFKAYAADRLLEIIAVFLNSSVGKKGLGSNRHVLCD